MEHPGLYKTEENNNVSLSKKYLRKRVIVGYFKKGEIHEILR